MLIKIIKTNIVWSGIHLSKSCNFVFRYNYKWRTKLLRNRNLNLLEAQQFVSKFGEGSQRVSNVKTKLGKICPYNSIYYDDKTTENLPLERFYNQKSKHFHKKFTKCTGKQAPIKNGKRKEKIGTLQVYLHPVNSDYT